MRNFVLYRIEDATGVSGTGVVAQGVEFSDRTVAMRWMGSLRSTAIYSSLDDLIEIHGHGGKTVIHWVGEQA